MSKNRYARIVNGPLPYNMLQSSLTLVVVGTDSERIRLFGGAALIAIFLQSLVQVCTS